jgi:hypothetical protein
MGRQTILNWRVAGISRIYSAFITAPWICIQMPLVLIHEIKEV